MARPLSLLGFFLVCAILVVAVVTADKPPKVPKPKKVKCHQKKLYPFCRGLQLYCPPACPRSCYVNCQTCSPVCYCNKPGGVCEDPRFVGGDGITFYFHGKKDKDFCLLSDSDLHINAHFIGKGGPNMTRDFTWVQAIAVLFGEHRLYVGAQKTAVWDDSVDRLAIAFDGVPVVLPTQEGTNWTTTSLAPDVRIVRTSDANAVTLEVDGVLKISANVVPITEEESRIHRYGINPAEDCFAHLELGFKFYTLSGEVDGVLGQTYREDYVSRVKVTSNMPVMGGELKFASSGLYAADCAVARFGRREAVAIALTAGRSDVRCGSDLGGRAIVCKK